VSEIRLYIDEDSMDQSFLQALRARGVDVRTAFDDGMVGHADDEQLRWATSQQRVLYSFNVGDFFQLHTAVITVGETHAGIILVQQQRYSVGDQMRAVLKVMAATSAEDMIDKVIFLSAWM
jgi:hypothetical protein